MMQLTEEQEALLREDREHPGTRYRGLANKEVFTYYRDGEQITYEEYIEGLNNQMYGRPNNTIT